MKNAFVVIWVAIVILKLAEVGIVKSWTWWFVLSPIWFVPLVFIIIFLFAGIYSYLKD